jgi:thioredoxin-like negative regulator of GroEL
MTAPADRIAYHFFSPTCGPCQYIKPTIADLIDDFPGIYFIGVNTKDDPQGIAGKLRVQYVPTFVILKAGVEIGRYTGSEPSMFFALCRKLMNA